MRNNYLRRKFSRRKKIFSFFNILKVFSFHKEKYLSRKIWLVAVFVIAIVIVFVYVISGLSHRGKKTNIPPSQSQSCSSVSGQVWCSAKSKCLDAGTQFCPDKVIEFVKGLKNELGLNFSDKGEDTFVWNTQNPGSQVSSLNLRGEDYILEGANMEQVQVIEKYLNNKMKIDDLNAANGVSGGLRGYYNNDMVCVLDFRYQKMKVNLEGKVVPFSDSLNVKLKCGFLNN